MRRHERKTRIPRSALKPMLATLIDAPFDDPGWVFETKWDGFRIVARIERGTIGLVTRGGKNVTKNYPPIAKALAKFRRNAVVDGELVALDEKGRSRFQLLQNALRAKVRLRYCVFDLLFIDGRDLRPLPLVERKKLLRRILPKDPALHFSVHAARNGVKFFRRAEHKGLEGIMAKRAQGRYYSGKRTREWLKIKTTLRQEVVIVGYTQPRQSRKYFGSLVLAIREGKSWRYAGHAGTGFNAAGLKSIHARLQSLAHSKKPITGKVPNEPATSWVKPRLVCEVKFTEWTKDGKMRHPVFVGLRTDKPASQVKREKAVRVKRR